MGRSKAKEGVLKRRRIATKQQNGLNVFHTRLWRSNFSHLQCFEEVKTTELVQRSFESRPLFLKFNPTLIR